MSLRLWAPLTGDLRQIGASNAVLTNDGATVDNNGKIGQCYAFANTHIIVDSTDIQDILSSTTQPFSMACWIYLNSDETDRVIIFGNYNANPFVNWELAANGTQRLYAGGTSNYTNKYNSTAVPKTTWTHIAVTYDGNVTTFYQNGTLTNTPQTGANTLTTKTANSRFYLGSDVRNDATRLKGKLNDFRFYDHCLSAAEVKEISQGLVLHYKLNSIDIKTGTNLVTSITKGGQTTLLTDGRIGVETSGTNADTYFTINLSESIVAGTSYFLSCDASGISAGQYWGFQLGQQNNGTLPFKIYNGHNEYAFTANDTLPNGNAMNWGTNRLFMDDNGRVDWANKAQFYNFQLVKIGTGTELIAGDSSGYGNNGIINSNPTMLSETMRYNCSISFDGVDDCIKIPFNNIIKDKNYTVSVWTYKTSIGTKNYQTILGGPSGFELEARSSSSTSPLYRIHNWGGGTTAYEFNKWNLFTFVHTDSDSKLYVNGELKITGTSANIPTGNYYIGAWNSVTGQNYEGLMSDFRIYATALSAEDILSLYHTSAKVDNQQNFHTFELEEAGGPELLAVPLTTSYGNRTNIYTAYNDDGEITLTGGSSIGSDYIPISPTGKVYYFDIDVSIDAGNQFYLGFERFDVDKAATSNSSCDYVVAVKPSSALVHQHYFGTRTWTANLSTGKPPAYIALRILNDWSGANGRKATIHSVSLREVTTLTTEQILKTGITKADEFIEGEKTAIQQNKIIRSKNFIEL